MNEVEFAFSNAIFKFGKAGRGLVVYTERATSFAEGYSVRVEAASGRREFYSPYVTMNERAKVC